MRYIYKLILLCGLISFLAKHSTAQTQVRVKTVTIDGTKRTSESYLRQIIRIKENTSLDSSLITEDIMRLKRLPSVAHAYFNVDSNYNVNYTIEESFTLIPLFNIYTSTQNNLAARIGVYEYNMLGRNIQAGGFYQRDVFNSFGINIRAPHLFSRRFGMGINVQQLSTLEPVFLEGGRRSDYQYTNTSAELDVLIESNFNNQFLAGVVLFNENYNYETGATDASVPQNLDINKILLKFNHSYNTIDYFYQYLDGVRTEANVQYVPGTDPKLQDFLVGRVDFMHYKRIKKKLNFATRLRLGLSSNSSSPFAPFAVDNNINIRGVGNIIDRGTAAAVFNTEMRYTLMDRNWFSLQGNAFIDMGTWRLPGGPLKDLISYENFRFHPGVGIRFINKKIVNAVLRLDYGFGPLDIDRANGFVIGIGQYF